MSIINDQLDFSTVANVFLVHGSLQSPAFLDGRLCAELGLHDVSAEAVSYTHLTLPTIYSV